jgi:transglutaminase-like putative cysteine protease
MQPRASSAGQTDGLIHFVYSDVQVRTDGAGTEVYQAFRAKLLRPEALVLGNINVAWMPDAGSATVHHLRIIRNGEVVDVLKDTKFAVFQPPNGIEYSILSGQRLANVQVPGLRVGDEIEFGYTIRSRELALPDHSYGLTQVAAVPASGSFRVRLTWPEGKEPGLRVSSDISGQLRRELNAFEVRLDDPGPLQIPADAPPRYAFNRAIEFSDFKSWQHLSAALAPLFSAAARLPIDSRVKELAAQIKASNSDPMSRARAALQLVQDEVRYVYVGMNGGNLVPAGADNTWQRRYGDCKGKTVLLMALLSEMEIPARPVAVNSNGGDGINGHLPNPQFFDHVLLQAQMAGQWYWLDGTRTGDLRLRTSPPDFYKWVLPLTAEGTDITAVPFVPLNAPETREVMHIDARAGYDKPTRFDLQKIIRGDAALAMRAALASLPAAQGESQLKHMFREGFTDVESVSWRFDVDSAAVILSVIATRKLDWDSVDGERRWASSIMGAGFYPPAQRRRPADQDAGAPWRNDPHEFSCYVTTIQLPKADAGWIWNHSAKAMDEVIGGVAFWRMADLTGDTMRTVMAKRTVRDELSAQDAEAANRQIPGFNNAQSRVYQVKGPGGPSALEVADPSIKQVPNATGHDWVRDASPCIAPRLR